MLTLEHDKLVFKFPEIHERAETAIDLQITLRIPDDAREYPLPPGLGTFPLRHTEDFAGRVPSEWAVRGGVMLPMFRTEAMWVNFSKGDSAYPCAIKVAAGKINAISGQPWKPELDPDDIDYLVVPHQPWLDGFAVGKGQIRQFVAMPLGGGYTAEEQITGKAEWGGLQIVVYPMKRERWEPIELARIERERREAEERGKQRTMYMLECAAAAPRPSAAAAACGPAAMCFADEDPSSSADVGSEPPLAMGLGAGGRMSQDIYRDPYGIDAWDQSVSTRCFLTLVQAEDWQRITGEEIRRKPPSPRTYAEHGLPWFDYANTGQESLPGAAALSALKTVGEVAEGKGLDPLPDNESVDPAPVVKLGPDAGVSLLASAKETGC